MPSSRSRSISLTTRKPTRNTTAKPRAAGRIAGAAGSPQRDEEQAGALVEEERGEDADEDGGHREDFGHEALDHAADPEEGEDDDEDPVERVHGASPIRARMSLAISEAASRPATAFAARAHGLAAAPVAKEAEGFARQPVGRGLGRRRGTAPRRPARRRRRCPPGRLSSPSRRAARGAWPCRGRRSPRACLRPRGRRRGRRPRAGRAFPRGCTRSFYSAGRRGPRIRRQPARPSGGRRRRPRSGRGRAARASPLICRVVILLTAGTGICETQQLVKAGSLTSQNSTINTGDTAWVLISAALVMLMTPGLAFFYGGLVRRKEYAVGPDAVLHGPVHNQHPMGRVRIQLIIRAGQTWHNRRAGLVFPEWRWYDRQMPPMHRLFRTRCL